MVEPRWLLVLTVLALVACSPEPAAPASAGSATTGSGDPADGGEPPAKSKPPQDAAAWAMFDRADNETYLASAAGLKDVTYDHRFSDAPGVHVSIRWVAPDHADARFELDDETMRAWAQENGRRKMNDALGVHELIVGRSNRGQYEFDELTVEGPNKVKVTARAPESVARFDTIVTTFDDRGLAVHSLTMRAGTTFDLSVTYRPGPDGRFLVDRVDSVTTKSDGEKSDLAMMFSYTRAGPYTVISKLTSPRSDGDYVQSFSNFVVDVGLRIEDFR